MDKGKESSIKKLAILTGNEDGEMGEILTKLKIYDILTTSKCVNKVIST